MEVGQENLSQNSQRVNLFKIPFTYGDKQYLKANIFKAIDQTSNKTVL
jgi:hypothetical protein